MSSAIQDIVDSGNTQKAGIIGAFRIIPAAYAILSIAALGLFGRIMSYPVQHDEQIHVAAGALMSKYQLYQDLGYNHLPNLPFLLNIIYSVTGTGHYLLAGRFAAVAWWIAGCLAIGLIAHRYARNTAVTILAVLLLLTNVLYLGQAGVLVTNNFAPIPFALFGFYFFTRALEETNRRFFRMFLAAACLSIAIGFKVNYIFLVPPFALAALLLPRESSPFRRLLDVGVPMLGGGIIGGLPTLYYLIGNPQSFLAHTMRYHTSAHRYYWATLDEPKVMNLAGKIRIAEEVWFSGTALLTLCLIGFLALLPRFTGGYHHRIDPSKRWPIFLAAALIVMGGLVSFLPTPSFAQYFSPPIAFTIVLAAMLLGPAARKLATPLLLTVALLSLASGASRLALGVAAAAKPGKWEGIHLHKQARQVADSLDPVPHERKIATLSPIYALEAGFSIYPEFAAGPFLYRVADHLLPGDRRYFRTASPAKLMEFLETDPPLAIIAGQEGQLDQGFYDYAAKHGYMLHQPAGKLPYQVFIKPKAVVSAQ